MHYSLLRRDMRLYCHPMAKRWLFLQFFLIGRRKSLAEWIYSVDLTPTKIEKTLFGLFDRANLPKFPDTDMIELYHLRSFPLFISCVEITYQEMLFHCNAVFFRYAGG